MNTSNKMTSFPGKPSGDAPYPTSGPFSGALQAAGECMCVAVRKALTRAYEDMRGQQTKAWDSAAMRVMSETLDLLANRRDEVVTAFNHAFAKRCNPELHMVQIQTMPRRGIDTSGLRLMSEDDHYDFTAPAALADAVTRIGENDTQAAKRQFDKIALRSGMRLKTNPIGPEVVGEAILDGLKRLNVGVAHRRIMMPRLLEHLPWEIRDCYRHINRLMSDDNLAAPRPASVEPPLVSPAPQAKAAAAGTAPATHPPVAPASIPPEDKAIPAPAQPSADEVLAQLQARESAQPEAVQASPVDKATLLHRIRDEELLPDLGKADVVTLDSLTAMLDGILADKQTPPAVRSVVDKIQLPLLRSALKDKGVLSEKGNAVRGLLENIAAAARSEEAEARGPGVYGKTRNLLRSALERFDDQLGTFAGTLDELRKSLNRDEVSPAIPPAPAAEASQKTKRMVRMADVHAALQYYLLNHSLSDEAIAFLFEHWRMLAPMVKITSADIEAGRAQPAGLLADLINSLDAKAWEANSSALAASLPSLLKRLQHAMQAAGLKAEDQSRFLGGLARYHAYTIKASQPVEAPAVSGFSSVETPVPPSTQVSPPTTSTAGISETVSTVDPVGSNEITGVPDQLKRGSWIEYTSPENTTIQARVSWVSPMRGLFLFTNRIGERALSFQADELAMLFRDGRVRMIADVQDTVPDGNAEEVRKRHVA